MLLIGLSDLVLETLVSGGILEIPLNVIDAIEKPLPKFRIDRMVLEFRDLFAEERAERVGVHLVESETDDGELLREEAFLREVDESRDEFTLGEVAAGAENHHHAGRAYGCSVGLNWSHPVDPVSSGQSAGESKVFFGG